VLPLAIIGMVIMPSNLQAKKLEGGDVDALCALINSLQDSHMQQNLINLIKSKAGDHGDIRIVIDNELLQFYVSSNDRMKIDLICY
jgi:hypothetical protein